MKTHIVPSSKTRIPGIKKESEPFQKIARDKRFEFDNAPPSNRDIVIGDITTTVPSSNQK